MTLMFRKNSFELKQKNKNGNSQKNIFIRNYSKCALALFGNKLHLTFCDHFIFLKILQTQLKNKSYFY